MAGRPHVYPTIKWRVNGKHALEIMIELFSIDHQESDACVGLSACLLNSNLTEVLHLSLFVFAGGA